MEADNQPERRTFSRSRSTAVLPHSASVISRPKAQSLDYSLEKQLGIIEEDDHEDVELVILRASGLRAADPGGEVSGIIHMPVDIF